MNTIGAVLSRARKKLREMAKQTTTEIPMLPAKRGKPRPKPPPNGNPAAKPPKPEAAPPAPHTDKDQPQ